MKLPSSIARQFLAAFEALAKDPGRRDLDPKPLAGRDGYRLRIGRWRALYRIEGDRMVILVLDVGARGDVYT
jgi:mRNA interferase RelE/StbE